MKQRILCGRHIFGWILLLNVLIQVQESMFKYHPKIVASSLLCWCLFPSQLTLCVLFFLQEGVPWTPLHSLYYVTFVLANVETEAYRASILHKCAGNLIRGSVIIWLGNRWRLNYYFTLLENLVSIKYYRFRQIRSTLIVIRELVHQSCHKMVRINSMCTNICFSLMLIALEICSERKSVYANSEEGKSIKFESVFVLV